MKKAIVLSIVMLCLLVAGANANAKTNQLGIFAGINFANVDLEIPEYDIDEFDDKTTVEIGLLYEIALGGNLGLCFQPMYIQKGANGDIMNLADVTVNAVYVELPIFLKLYFGSQAIRPYIMAGPFVGYNLSFNIEAESVLADKPEEVDIKDYIKSFDMGVGGGAGISINMDKIIIFAEVKYMMGLVNINGFEEGDSVEIFGQEFGFTESLKTKGIQIMAGITFPLGQ